MSPRLPKIGGGAPARVRTSVVDPGGVGVIRERAAALAASDAFVALDVPLLNDPRSDAKPLPAVGRAKRKPKEPALDLRAELHALQHDEGRPLAIKGGAIAGVPVKDARTVNYLGLAPKSFPENCTTVIVDFGPLDRAQFDALHAELGGRSHVTWEPGRSYTLADFLPPKVQALLGKDLEIPEMRVVPGSEKWGYMPWDEEKSVDLTMNCHATAYEALRAYQGDESSVTIFLGDMVRMDDLAAGRDFDKITELDPAFPVDLERLPFRPGDLLQLFESVERGGFARMSNLLHSAVYVGGGLFFEKSDTELSGRDYPYRLVTAQQMVVPIEKFLGGQTPRAVLYRAVNELPPPEDVFGASEPREIAAWEKTHKRPIGMPLAGVLELSLGGGVRGEWLTAMDRIPLRLDEHGRGELAPRAP